MEKEFNVEKLFEIIKEFHKKLANTNLQSQIDFIKFMNDNLIKAPLFISILNSLKELQAIKRNNNLNLK
jgi:hypothetical protein